eukprot:jgi/Astpho2/2052/Aster-00548
MSVSRNGGGSNAYSELQPEPGTRIAAAVENRAGEVGIAALDTSSLKLALVQLVETSRSYSSTKYGCVSSWPALNCEQWHL